MRFQLWAIAWLILAVVPIPRLTRAEPINRARLERMRLSVESFTSRIQNLRLVYTLDWVPDRESPDFRRLNAQILKMLEDRERAEADPARRELIAKTIESHRSDGSSFSCKLIYAFPAMRHERVALKQAGGEVGPSTLRIGAVNGRSFMGLDFLRKTAISASQVSDRELQLFERLPTASLGLRSYPVGGPDNQRLESLLSHPEISSLEGQGRIGSIDTVILKVGPGIPEDDRPGGLGDGGYVKLWLAPAHNHLAIRKEYHVMTSIGTQKKPHELIYAIELADFRPVQDLSRNRANLYFPFMITYKDRLGSSISRVSSVTLNSPLRPEEFSPPIPEGFAVSVDGGTVRKLAGGTTARRRIARDTARAARAMLEAAPPAARGDPSPLFGLGFQTAGALACVAGLAVFWLFRRRVRHAS